jgi:hypothetical protein
VVVDWGGGGSGGGGGECRKGNCLGRRLSWSGRGADDSALWLGAKGR